MIAPAMTPEFDAFLRATLDRLAGKRSWTEALQLAEWIANLLALNAVGIYRLDELETLLVDRLPPEPDGPVVATRPELHVATCVYPYGGHSALMRHLVRQSPHDGDVLLTGMADPADAARILGVPAERIVACPAQDDGVRLVRDLVDILARYRRVVLHIHPTDVRVAVAVRLLKRRSPHVAVHFVNHADHLFSVAVGAADRVLEISGYGWALRERRGTLATSSFIGLPISPPPAATVPAVPRPDAILLTGGAAYKFRPVAGMNLPAAFVRLLTTRPCYRLHVIGPKAHNPWWWSLRLRHPRRVRFLKLSAKDAYLEHVRASTIYVDSHPLPGGTAFPEALIQGRLVAGLRGCLWGYSPADQLLSPDVDSFIAHCVALAEADPEALARQEAVRRRCLEFHAPEAVRSRMDDALGGDLVPPPPDLGRAPAVDAAWPATAAWHVPSYRACAVSGADREWLAGEYRRSRGWLDRGAWTLWRYARRSRR